MDTVVNVFTVNCTDSLSLPERLWPAVNGPGRLAVSMVICVVCVSLSCECCKSLFSPKDINIQLIFHQNGVLIQKKNIALTLGSGDKATLTLRYVELEKAEGGEREGEGGRFENNLQS